MLLFEQPVNTSLTPHGVSGLKCHNAQSYRNVVEVSPRMG